MAKDEQPLTQEPGGRAFQPHYTIAEIAKEWRLSQSTVLRMFKGEEGVLRIGNTRTRKRTKISLRIPKDVAERVYREMTGLIIKA